MLGPKSHNSVFVLFFFVISANKTHTDLWEAIWAIIHDSLGHAYSQNRLNTVCKTSWLYV